MLPRSGGDLRYAIPKSGWNKNRCPIFPLNASVIILFKYVSTDNIEMVVLKNFFCVSRLFVKSKLFHFHYLMFFIDFYLVDLLIQSF